MKKFSELLKKFSGLKEEDQENFLEVFFTGSEKKNFEERIKILESLKKGKTQRQIASELGISITTVTRGNKVFKISTEEVKGLF